MAAYDFEVKKYSKKMNLIAEEGIYQLFEYLPSALHPLAIPFEKLTKIRRLRFLYEYIHKRHYKVYYLAISQEFVGHCVVSPGGRRLWVSKKNDIVLGPYFILPQYRGNGCTKILVSMTLMHCSYDYKVAYDWIHYSNYASIKTSEACGFQFEGSRLNIVGLTRRILPKENGEYSIFIYKKQSNNT